MTVDDSESQVEHVPVVKRRVDNGVSIRTSDVFKALLFSITLSLLIMVAIIFGKQFFYIQCMRIFI